MGIKSELATGSESREFPLTFAITKKTQLMKRS